MRRYQTGLTVIETIIGFAILAAVAAAIVGYLIWASENVERPDRSALDANLWVTAAPVIGAPQETALLCEGDSATLIWGSENGEEASISPPVSEERIDVRGEAVVTPTSRTEYLLTVAAENEAVTDNALIRIINEKDKVWQLTLSGPVQPPGQPLQSLIWSGEINPGVASPRVRVEKIVILNAPYDWGEWMFVKNEEGITTPYTIRSPSNEVRLSDTPTAVGEWQVTPIDLPADNIVDAKQSTMTILMDLVCE